MTAPTDSFAAVVAELPPMAELIKVIAAESPEFSAWRNAQPDKYWKNWELGAIRIGYELGLRRIERLDAEMREALLIANQRGDEWRRKFNDDTDTIAELRARLEACEKALKGLYDMYSHAWDLADGSGLIMLADSIPRFEAAHNAAHLALGYPELIGDEEDELASRPSPDAMGGEGGGKGNR